jgi:hypothetical protein
VREEVDKASIFDADARLTEASNNLLRMMHQSSGTPSTAVKNNELAQGLDETNNKLLDEGIILPDEREEEKQMAPAFGIHGGRNPFGLALWASIDPSTLTPLVGESNTDIWPGPEHKANKINVQGVAGVSMCED